jgi:membrane fusion protein, multidrug efflux system
MMSKDAKRKVAGVLSLLVLAVLVWTVMESGGRAVQARDDDDEEEEAIQAPSRVSVQNGQTVITLDAATQQRMGLKVTTLRTIVARAQIQALAAVLPVDALASLRTNYVAAQAKVQGTRASLEATRKEDDRLKSLYQDDQNASLKALEAQDAALRSDEADMDASERDLAAQAELARLQWGAVIADWVQNGSPELDGILNQQELLVEVTLPPGQPPAAPPSILLETPSGSPAKASLVSVFPRVDPRIQGPSFLYRTPASNGLAPSMSLAARLSVGPAAKGVFVPDAAVMWWQGMAWVYVQTSAEHFVRREVPTSDHLENGWFTSTGLSAQDKIVTVGGQSLLSEEFRSEIETEE